MSKEVAEQAIEICTNVVTAYLEAMAAGEALVALESLKDLENLHKAFKTDAKTLAEQTLETKGSLDSLQLGPSYTSRASTSYVVKSSEDYKRWVLEVGSEYGVPFDSFYVPLSKTKALGLVPEDAPEPPFIKKEGARSIVKKRGK